MLNKLQQKRVLDIIFSSESDAQEDIFINPTYVYAIVDGARATEVFNNLIIWDSDFRILYKGKDAEDLKRVAPYIIKLKTTCKITKWIIKNLYGSKSCIFLKSYREIDFLSSHFSQYTKVKKETVDFNNSIVTKKVFLAFYDPRVFPCFIKCIREIDLMVFHEPIICFLLEDDDYSDIFIKYSFNYNNLVSEKIKLNAKNI